VRVGGEPVLGENPAVVGAVHLMGLRADFVFVGTSAQHAAFLQVSPSAFLFWEAQPLKGTISTRHGFRIRTL